MAVTEQDAIPPSPATAPAAIAGGDISKSFGAVRALTHASLSARYGEVHALVGENGAGKSTMIKILSGVVRPDSGQVIVDGQEVTLHNPEQAQELGIGTVFQELTLLPWMTVAENLLLRHEPRGPLGIVQRGRMVPETVRIFEQLGIEGIDPRVLVTDLSLAQRQIIEIAHTIIRRPRILFMDEPTSSLGEKETEWLFGQIRRLREQNTCIIFTSHRWREIRTLADRITVFRNGETVGTYDELTEEEAITLMTGRRVDAQFPEPPPLDEAPSVLVTENLTAPSLNNISLELRQGEILGVGGLEGQGHRELFLTLFGVRKATGGQIIIDGKQRKIRSPHDAIRAGMGIALVPEDRKKEGLLLPMSVGANLTLAVLGAISDAGVIQAGKERRLVRRMVDKLQIRTRGAEQPVRTLSGGNQQKVLIGRWLLANSHILLLYDVTRGVDVATKHDIYELMLQLVSEGRSILFYSSDTEEIARLSHRVIVLRDGQIAAELPGPGIDPEAIVAASVRGRVAV